MSNGLAQAKQELRSVPTAALQAMFDDNVAEYEMLRAQGVPCYSPSFDRNCTMFLILSDALAERGIVAQATGTAPTVAGSSRVAKPVVYAAA